MLKPFILSLWIMTLSSGAAFAAPSINDMQGCQAYLDFVANKLTDLKDVYSIDDISSIRRGLSKYNQHIQRTIITPGLLEFTGNDAQKAKETQLQIDAYKTHVSESLKQKYQKNKLLSDYAIAIDECAKKAMPAGAVLQELKTAVELIVSLAKQD
ncbi:hypothetical protein [Shewanella sp. SR44-3]|uniref:hypothetical protein n=1 Tax=unclassified Shewanella TaxID=196818 RepID=UPI0015FBE43A|nr:hypothetical protein [Shewanella sp. SR44-3]MBB1269543.1 hypothetical protein [Shewanella sp. SR44-3]